MRASHVLVMAKEPVPGRVKTRLMPSFTRNQAADIAAAALADALEAVTKCSADRWILALDGRPGPWLPCGFEVVAQQGTCFQERLSCAWAWAGGPGLQIGMDTPQLTSSDLDQALEALVRPDTQAVLGPTIDGGWWGLGLMRADPRMFIGVPMSTASTGQLQLARLHRLGLRTTILPIQRDLDEAEDALAIASETPHLRTAAAVRDCFATT
jgi:hypothetical protein